MILPANVSNQWFFATGLCDRRLDIANSRCGSTDCGGIRTRRMKQMSVMKRCLSRLQFDCNTLAFFDIYCDFLPATKQVVLCKSIDMLNRL